jgi:magnesium transporter
MIRAYALTADRLKPLAPEADDVVWWNLVNPDRSAETSLETRLCLELPTKDEMQEIEISSRLY